MKGRVESIRELKRKYAGEWIAVKVAERNGIWPVRGVLLAHNPDWGGLHRELREKDVSDAYVFLCWPYPQARK